MTIGRSVLLLLAACAAFGANAKQLGQIGPTYGISEPSFLDFIQQRLREKERSGELRKLEQEAQRRAIEAVENPPPVAGLTRGDTRRTFYYDPTFSLKENVFDAEGRLLFPAGTKTNPLAIVSLPEQLLFFDGRDSRQVGQAQALMAKAPLPVKPILVGGSYRALMKQWKRPVFYDQQGRLVRRFGITHVPALVSQEGMRLRIDELVAGPQ